YGGTTLAAIARGAKLSIGNVYVYFKSKVEIFFALYGPWLRQEYQQLEQSAARIQGRERRLQHIITAVWFDIPHSRRGFTINLAPALSAAEPSDRDFDLFIWAGAKLTDMIRACLPEARHSVLDGGVLSDILLLTYVGYSINYRLGFP